MFSDRAVHAQTLARDDVALFQERIPNCRISFIDGAPHVLSASVPDQFVPLVKDFLAQPLS